MDNDKYKILQITFLYLLKSYRMKFKKLLVNDFRRFKNEEIEFGELLTVIAGQNGTGKSSLLGWIAQSCSTSLSNKTLTNERFKSQYSEIFRFCEKNDYHRNYNVEIKYMDEEPEQVKRMTTRLLRASKRYKVDFDSRGKAIDWPVIYLGLKRLIPLATEKAIAPLSTSLSEKLRREFSSLSKDILFITRDNVGPEFVKSTNKHIIAMKTDYYGHLGNSAGQDNLGQIISALLSFEKLKDELKQDYSGGLLIIDEIDATLYAGSQIKLIEKLFKYAKDLKIQIIFTTHSMEILDYLTKRKTTETRINFLVEKDGEIKNKIDPTFEYIRNKINVQVSGKTKAEKIEFMCEDEVAEKWGRNLLNGSDLKDKIVINHGPFPAGTLKAMAESNHKLFKEVYFILDGDSRKDKASTPARTIYLPGKNAPESTFFTFIKGLPDEDEFWDDDNNFSHQTCFGANAKEAKPWFNSDLNKQFFGKGFSRLFNRWKKANTDMAATFINDIKNVLD